MRKSIEGTGLDEHVTKRTFTHWPNVCSAYTLRTVRGENARDMQGKHFVRPLEGIDQFRGLHTFSLHTILTTRKRNVSLTISYMQAYMFVHPSSFAMRNVVRLRHSFEFVSRTLGQFVSVLRPLIRNWYLPGEEHNVLAACTVPIRQCVKGQKLIIGLNFFR